MGDSVLTNNAIKTVAELAQEAITPQIIRPENEADDVYYIHDKSTGGVSKVYADPGTYNCVLEDLNSFMNWVRQYPEDQMEIFITDNYEGKHYCGMVRAIGLVHIPGGYVRIRHASYKLPYHASYIHLMAGVNEVSLNDLLQLIKTVLYKSVSNDDLEHLIKLNWERSNSDENNKVESSGIESVQKFERYLSKAKPKQLANLPEFLELEVSIFDTPDCRNRRYPVKVAFSADPLHKLFSLTAVVNSLENARHQAVEDLSEKIKSEMNGYQILRGYDTFD
jgi:hypothetical protein